MDTITEEELEGLKKKYAYIRRLAKVIIQGMEKIDELIEGMQTTRNKMQFRSDYKKHNYWEEDDEDDEDDEEF